MLNHCERRISIQQLRLENRQTLYRQPAWNLFLHVRQGFLGKLPSIALIILQTAPTWVRHTTLAEEITYE